jgi:AraC-like DNA-binding protein
VVDAGIRYTQVPVDASLAPYVQLIWTFEVDVPTSFGSAERIFPDGIVEAIFHYRTPFDMRYRCAPFSRQPASLVVSQTRSFLEIEPAGTSGFVSVRFHPWGACHFFEHPISAFADQMVAAIDVWGDDATFVEERIATVTSARERVDVIQQFLMRQLRRYRRDSIEILVRRCRANHGRDRVAHLCRDIGVSERMLERTFRNGLGYSPKHFLRLSRFLHTCHLLRHSARPHLTHLAHQAGYYDQAHCIADFTAFAGMTPRAFVSADKAAFLDIG